MVNVRAIATVLRKALAMVSLAKMELRHLKDNRNYLVSPRDQSCVEAKIIRQSAEIRLGRET